MTDTLAKTTPTAATPRGSNRAPGRRAWTGLRSVRSIVKHAMLILCALVMLYPVLWMVVSSLRPNDVIFRDPSLLLNDLQTGNYAEGWNAFADPFSVYLINSSIVVLGAIVGNLVSCSMAAYAFARLEFTGKRLWFAIMLLTIMLPIHVIIVPQYVLFSQLGWVNTFLPLIVPKLLATDAFFVFLMVQFIRGIPIELDEAARIDGAGHPRIFAQVILPLFFPATRASSPR
nr:carbohydrate ABC transporter permease [Glycomyces buryatensis]